MCRVLDLSPEGTQSARNFEVELAWTWYWPYLNAKLPDVQEQRFSDPKQVPKGALEVFLFRKPIPNSSWEST